MRGLFRLGALALLILSFPAGVLGQASDDDFLPEMDLDELILRVEDGGDFSLLNSDLFVGYRVENGEPRDGLDEDDVAFIEEAGIEHEYVYSAELDRPGDEFRTTISHRILVFDDVADALDYPELLFDQQLDADTDIHEDVEAIDEDDLPRFEGTIFGWQGDATYVGDDTNPFMRYLGQMGNVVFSVAVYSEDKDEVEYIIEELFDEQWDCIEDDEECEPIPFPDPGEAASVAPVAIFRPGFV
jgi:hypothetical protein